MDYPIVSSSSSTSSKAGQDTAVVGVNSDKNAPFQPYHITHGATAYQQVIRRTQSQPLLFSSSGFDIIGVLTRVATRSNPTVFIGPVDFSCAFIVADAQAPDFPVVYASPPLAKMTGYGVTEFVGQSCRFLQWPNGGKGPRESHRSNDEARLEITRSLSNNTECQTTLINYRKSGEMFMNFVTIIPITWDSPEIKFFVGFQVDISEPARLYAKNPPIQNINVLPSSPEAPISDRLRALIAPAKSVEEQRERFFEFLLNNMDDFILALSSDGIIYQAAGRVGEAIGWRPEELVGRSIACFIHPADVDKVHNELASFRFISPPPRTSSSIDIAGHYSHQNRIIHLLYRAFLKRPVSASMRGYHAHRYSSFPGGIVPYVYLESSGRMHIESPGKAFLILSTRIVDVPRLTHAQVESAGGFRLHGTGVIWARVSLDGGIILSALSRNTVTEGPDSTPSSKDAEDLLGVPPSALVGTRLHDWVSYEFVASIDSVLNDIRQGSVKPLPSWSKPRRVMAMMPSYESPAPNKALTFGKPILITIFPADPLNTTPSTPVSTTLRPGDATGALSDDWAVLGAGPGTGGKEWDTPPLATSLICRLTLPLQALPDGMLSPTGTPRTNQAYLYDPFGAFRPRPRTTPSQININKTPNNTMPPASHNTPTSASPPQRQSGFTGDVFESLSAFADLPNGAPRWDDQLEMLRAQNARMQAEIDELLCMQKSRQLPDDAATSKPAVVSRG